MWHNSEQNTVFTMYTIEQTVPLQILITLITSTLQTITNVFQ